MVPRPSASLPEKRWARSMLQQERNKSLKISLVTTLQEKVKEDCTASLVNSMKFSLIRQPSTSNNIYESVWVPSM